MRYLLFFLILSVVIGVSCQKSGAGGSQTLNPNGDSSLVGAWKWVLQTDAKAVYGIPYDSLTPQNTGIADYLQINSDSSWTQTDNGLQTGQGRITMKHFFSPAGPLFSLDFTNGSGRDSLVNHTLSTTGDTLVIFAEQIIDKYWVRVYVRQTNAK